jgi:serine/threonine protein kinase
MAKIVRLTDQPEPVNAGEQRVLDHLASSLPDSVTLIPNLTIPYHRPEQPEEYDIIAVTPDSVFAIEVKDLAPPVEITEQQMFVNGNPRGNPYLRTRSKAQKLKTKLSLKLPWFEHNGWVEHLVVLARKPESLSICEAMKSRVVLLNDASSLLSPGTALLKKHFHGQLLGKETQIVSAITDGASERSIPVSFGDFKATSLMFRTERFEAWRARHMLTDVDVVLEVHRLDPRIPQQQITNWKANCLEIEDISRQIGASSDIDGPRQSFQLTDGTLVVVWPDREPNILRSFLNQMRLEGSGFDSAKARCLIEGFCGALAHLHSRGWVLGKISEHNLAVRPSGRGAVVLGDPKPTQSLDTAEDLAWLSSIIVQVNEIVKDDKLSQLAKGLELQDAGKRISAIIAMAALAGADLRPAARERDLLSRFTKTQVVSSHQYGRTLLAHDSQLNREVIVKHETGRPEMSWAIREYRTLSLPFVANNPRVASSTAGDSTEDSSFVSIEVITAPTLASMIDTGVLRDPEKALAVTAQLLDGLKSIHPDIKAILSLISAVDGVVDEKTQAEIGVLRENGIAHNHLDASNIFVHQDRGVVLTDFVRAARFSENIPARTVTYWPKDLPLTVSNPLADLYAVGSLLLRMLTTTPQGIKASGTSTDDLGKQLLDVALKAIDDDPDNRFKSADEFLDVLLSKSVAGSVPTITDDILKLQQRIEALVNEQKFEEALSICPVDWIVTRERITEKQKLLNTRGIEIWKSGNVTLRYIGQAPLQPGSTAANVPHDGGVAEIYQSTDADGGVIEILVCAAVIDQKIVRWTATGNGFGYPDRLSHAVRSLRISISDQNGLSHMELMQAQLKREPKYPNQCTKKMVNKEQLSRPVVGNNAEQVFRQFGAKGFATKSELWGETGGHKNYLAVTFADSATHLPALAHFVSRILPLYAGITEA